jgi:Mor family transcriptional regulator
MIAIKREVLTKAKNGKWSTRVVRVKSISAYQELAKKYKVAEASISAIRLRQTWRHV